MTSSSTINDREKKEDINMLVNETSQSSWAKVMRMYTIQTRTKKKKELLENVQTHLFLLVVELFPLGTEEFAYFTYKKPKPSAHVRDT